MDKNLPKWIFRYLELTCAARFLDELEGDLLEIYDRDKKQFGQKKAERKFILRGLFSIRWYRIPALQNLGSLSLLHSHLKTAIRQSARQRSVTFIHLLGLMLGIIATMFIALYTKQELSFDIMHEKGADLYRVLKKNPETGERNHSTSSRIGEALIQSYPFIEICRFGNDPVKIGDQHPILIEEFFWADSTFFEFFSFDFIAGDPSNCLKEINKLVITQSLSQQIFGSSPALGKTVKVKVYDGDEEFQMQVAGVVKDPPANTHIQFRALGSMANAEKLYASLVRSWGFNWLRTYMYDPVKRIAEIKSNMPGFIDHIFGDEAPPEFGLDFQPFQDVYLKSQDIAKNTFTGNIRNIYIFIAIALLILLLSIFNYINLSTARMSLRGKEIGVRKVLGSRRFSILTQILVESFLLTFISSLMAMGILFLLLPFFNRLFQLELSFAILDLADIFYVFLAIFALGLLAGILPGLAFAKISILKVKRSNIQFNTGLPAWRRQLFIGFQYLVTVILLSSTAVIYTQYQYMKDFDLGFTSNQLLHVKIDDRKVQEQIPALKDQIAQISGITAAASSGEDLPSELNNTWGLNWNGSGRQEPLSIDIVGVDRDYFKTVEIHFKEGHNFNRGFELDSAYSVILNEKAGEMIGLKNLVGKKVMIGGREREVIGIVEDHHNLSLHSETLPLAYFIYPPGYRVSPDNLFLRIENNNIDAVLNGLADIWQEFSSDPIEYNFVDEAFATTYESEKQFSTLISSFSFLAIAISLISLFGLISFIIQIKQKELSIRQVLGANMAHIFRLLGSDFARIFLITLLLSIPLSFFILKNWLNNFPYRINLDILPFLWSVLICLLFSILVVFYHFLRVKRLDKGNILLRDN